MAPCIASSGEAGAVTGDVFEDVLLVFCSVQPTTIPAAVIHTIVIKINWAYFISNAFIRDLVLT